MTRWEHLVSAIRFRKSEIVTVVRPERLPDKRVTQILQGTHEEHLLYRAFMQLLEDLREDAVGNIAEDAMSPTAMAMDAGGAKYLKALRDDIIRRRSVKKTAMAAKPVTSDV